MKKHLAHPSVINSLIGLTVAAILLNLYFINKPQPATDLPDPGSWNYTVSNHLKPVDPVIPQGTPYEKYEQLRNQIRKTRELRNGTWFTGISTNFIGAVATGSGLLCDTCTILNYYFDMPGVRQSYIKLPGWKLPERHEYLNHYDSVRFYVENRQPYIRKTVISHVSSQKNADLAIISFVDVPVKFWYDDKLNCVMIPVSAITKTVSDWCIGAVAIGYFAIMLYVIFGLINWMINISRGNAFTPENLKWLRLIAVGFLSMPVFTCLLNVVLRLAFNSYLTNDVVMNPAIWRHWWIYLSAGLVFLLLYKAFAQGKQYKDELQFTV